MPNLSIVSEKRASAGDPLRYLSFTLVKGEDVKVLNLVIWQMKDKALEVEMQAGAKASQTKIKLSIFKMLRIIINKMQMVRRDTLI